MAFFRRHKALESGAVAQIGSRCLEFVLEAAPAGAKPVPAPDKAARVGPFRTSAAVRAYRL
jgi:hypothetical protein